VTDPVGLTRAEEELQREPLAPRIVVRAPPGAVQCRVLVPPRGDVCEAAATYRIVWSDSDVTPACADCALRTQELARSHRTVLKIEPLVKP